MGPVLEGRGLVKRFGRITANDGIDLAVMRGEVHAVMGENGAGKSTLMNILYGVQRPDAGEIWIDGERVRLRSPSDAIARGLGMIHQAFKLFASLTTWENIVYGCEPRRGLLIDRSAACARVATLAARYRLAVDLNAPVSRLSVGERQRVEILKALYRDARILILDEPTAVLTPREREGLFAVMRSLVADGRTLLFVTHKLDEVLAISNRVTVLRDGRVVARLVTRETSARAIARAMTGRNLAPLPMRTTVLPGAALLDVRGVTLRTRAGRPVVSDVSFVVRAGEIVGIAGVAGNGQAELVQALVGLRRPDAGLVRIVEQDVTLLDAAQHRAAGLAYIPEDRSAVGTALPASAAENLAMGFQRRPPLASGPWLDRMAMRAWAQRLIGSFAIRIPDDMTPAAQLSGGNLQKLVVARELAHNAPVLIAEQPTRGVDIGASEFIHRCLAAERNKAHAVLLVSAELAEILALSDRILVMFEGRIIAALPAAEANEERLGLLMAGRLDEAA